VWGSAGVWVYRAFPCRWHSEDRTLGCDDERALQFDHKAGGGSAARGTGKDSQQMICYEIRISSRHAYEGHYRSRANRYEVSKCSRQIPYNRLHSTSRLGLLRLCENWTVEHFSVVIHADPEGGFWAEVPALPGCYSQGETIDELRENIREAIAGVLEVMREQGRQPEPNIQILEIPV
jgi:predicted RNase H-like HicB family nuclease